MSAYFVIDLFIPDKAKLQEYERGADPVLKKYGATVLARGEHADVIEGDWRPTHLVIIEFADTKSIHDFYNDPDYQPLKRLRHNVKDATANALAVEGS